MKVKDGVKERLLQYIDYINSKPARFEKECGLSNGYIKNMRKSISYEKLEQILKIHGDLSKEWLMTGEGEMLINEDCKKIGEVKSHDNADAEYWKAKYEECFAELQRQKGISEGLRIALGVSRDAIEHSSMVAR